jgi:dTMP kinase
MSARARGRFIVFEGIDASGKSTQVHRLASYLESQNRPVHVTAEPTSGPIGSLIRQAFSNRVPLDDRTIAALFVADRIDHLTNARDGLLTMLDQGTDVISDRYYLSSLAYHASDVSMDWIVNANSVSTDLLRPDITFYLDLPPEEALSRLQRRAGLTDKFEVFDRINSAYANYGAAVERFRVEDRIRSVSAVGSPETVFERVKHEFGASDLAASD